MKRVVYFLAIFGLAASINCNNTKNLTSQTEVLFRSDWKLTEVNGQSVPDSMSSRFQFSPGKISGSTGCNRLSAGFVAGSKQSIRFSNVASTKMACTNESVAALETKFLDALSQSNKWSIEKGELWLGTGETTLIKLGSIQ